MSVTTVIFLLGFVVWDHVAAEQGSSDVAADKTKDDLLGRSLSRSSEHADLDGTVLAKTGSACTMGRLSTGIASSVPCLPSSAQFVPKYSPQMAPRFDASTQHGTRGSPLFAHKKGGGSTLNGRDSNAKYLGVKVPGNSFVKAGTIIVRQRAPNIKKGRNVGQGSDYTMFAREDGMVHFETSGSGRKKVSILPLVHEVDYVPKPPEPKPRDFFAVKIPV